MATGLLCQVLWPSQSLALILLSYLVPLTQYPKKNGMIAESWNDYELGAPIGLGFGLGTYAAGSRRTVIR